MPTGVSASAKISRQTGITAWEARAASKAAREVVSVTRSAYRAHSLS
jgi:hypothetical protein